MGVSIHSIVYIVRCVVLLKCYTNDIGKRFSLILLLLLLISAICFCTKTCLFNWNLLCLCNQRRRRWRRPIIFHNKVVQVFWRCRLGR